MLKRLIPLLIIIFVVVACSTANEETTANDDTEIVAQQVTDVPVVMTPTSEPATAQPTNIATDVPVVEATAIPTLEPTPIPETNAYNPPDWALLSLVNAQTGATFTIADFAGKTVFVEPMATWCSNCRAQQGYVAEAMASLNPDDFVFISLSVGENVSNEVLASYAMRNNFPQVFAVATPDMMNALVQAFGFSVTSPPSTPHFTISPTGTVSALSTGYHRADAIINEVTAVQNS